ncbi:glycoside hydrolase family 10 protein [Streptomyces sp. NPDC058985]|uniref:glycoside hydrolase family 10 protein n=1 Tax=Streptomyces sp. NPDC058985 TaxID=3346684 RepID=UPI003680D5E8
MPDKRLMPHAFLTAAALSAALIAPTTPATAASAATPNIASRATGDAAKNAAAAQLQAPVSRDLDAVDPTAETNPGGVDSNGTCFPGCRGTNQLIAYTPAYTSPSSGTNEYGQDVVVEDGRITAIGGSDRTIPANGLVLSGHGTAAKWLAENARIGTKVEITGRKLTLTVDTESHVVRAEVLRDDARARLGRAKDACTVFPEPEVTKGLAEAGKAIAAARSALDEGRDADAVALATQAATTATGAADQTRESRPVEGRGVWVRPKETTPEAIRATLDRIEYAGFNMVYLETVWQGYTIFPSDAAKAAGVEAQRPNMKGFDPLKVWIEEAHKRGIELHAWTHTFFVGSEGAGDDSAGGQAGPGPILKAHPEWAAVERSDVGKVGPQPSTMEPGYYWVDPAMPEVRDYVRSVFRELMTDYDIDGLHLDYIRYPVSLPYESSFSYSDYSRQAFEEKYGVDPYELKQTDPEWETFDKWRENNVTTFVQSVRQMQREIDPGLPLSGAVFADPVDGLKKKFQNWADWIDKDYLDFLTGMSFGSSPESVGEDTQVMRDRVGDAYLYTATYGPINGSPSDVMGDQLQAVKDAGSDGTALFAYNQLTDAQIKALHDGAYRTEARAPHADPADAARRALGPLTDRLTSASGKCVADGDARKAATRLTVARTLLEISGDRGAAPARRQLEKAAELAGHWEEPQPGFSATTTRDLLMLTRWLEQAER